MMVLEAKLEAAMDLKQMQYFLCLAQEGNVTRAARQLNYRPFCFRRGNHAQACQRRDEPLWINRQP
jgi:regulatory helix-turn-helix LysR family protein